MADEIISQEQVTIVQEQDPQDTFQESQQITDIVESISPVSEVIDQGGVTEIRENMPSPSSYTSDHKVMLKTIYVRSNDKLSVILAALTGGNEKKWYRVVLPFDYPEDGNDNPDDLFGLEIPRFCEVDFNNCSYAIDIIVSFPCKLKNLVHMSEGLGVYFDSFGVVSGPFEFSMENVVVGSSGISLYGMPVGILSNLKLNFLKVKCTGLFSTSFLVEDSQVIFDQCEFDRLIVNLAKGMISLEKTNIAAFAVGKEVGDSGELDLSVHYYSGNCESIESVRVTEDNFADVSGFKLYLYNVIIQYVSEFVGQNSAASRTGITWQMRNV